jgi:hypothetical protein
LKQTIGDILLPYTATDLPWFERLEIMKTYQLIHTVSLALALLVAGANAQPTNQPVVPSTPAVAPAPDETIYAPGLPDPAALVKAAAAQRLVIEQINRTGTAEVVLYRRADGQPHVVAYQLLPGPNAAPADGTTAAMDVPATEAEGNPVVVATTPPPSTVVYSTPTVVYAPPTPVYCYDYSPYSWPWFGSVYYTGGFYSGARYYRANDGFRHYSTRPLYRHYSNGPAYRGFAGRVRDYHYSGGAPGARRWGESSGHGYSHGQGDGHSGQRDGGRRH